MYQKPRFFCSDFEPCMPCLSEQEASFFTRNLNNKRMIELASNLLEKCTTKILIDLTLINCSIKLSKTFIYQILKYLLLMCSRSERRLNEDIV